jgi:DNA gyrase subunit B
MMGEITVTDQEIYYLTWLLCNLCAIGTVVKFNSIDNMGQKKSLVIKNTKGIYEFIDTICEKKVFEPIYFTEDNGSMKLEVLLTYDIKNMDDPNIMSFGNTCPTNGGTHVDGFMDAVVKFFRDYMNKIYLVNNKKLTVTAQDIRTGLRAVVSCFHIKPLFTGQSKEIFSKEDMKPYAYGVTLRGLESWAQSNPADLQKISKYLKEVCEIRMKSEGEKIKMSDKYTASVVSGMPAKYKKPNGKGPFEVIIGEGDSAISGMENNRDKSSQGLFPIRGKILNAMTTPVKKFFENEEICGMFKIFGYNGYSKTFDPTKFRPSKVIIATDADADGKHIESLLMLMFLKYLPFVILEGKLYCANPPLYGISTGKNKMKFFADNIEYIEYVQDLFCKDNKIESVKGKPLTKKEITNIIYKNIDYVKIINHICNTYSIDPWLLEYILYNLDLMKDFKKFKKAIEKQYKFTTVVIENGIIIVRGLVGSKYQTVFCNQMLLNDARPLIDLINRSDDYYIINGNKSSIYDLMLLFNSFEPKSLTRYKGLGKRTCPITINFVMKIF